MQNKHSLPHIVSLLLIFAFAIGALFSVGAYIGRTNQALALTTISQPVGGAGIQVYEYGLGGGRCVHIALDNNGYMIASGSYTGVYNASYDCVRALAGGGNSLSSKTNLLMKPEGLSLSIIGDAASYIGSDIGLATLQLKLASAGVLAESDITGQYTIQTFEGIKAFQTKNKLPATGFPDEKTITLLNSIQFSKTTITGITKTLYEVKTSISQQPTQTIITPTPGKQTDTVLPKSSTEAPGTTPKTVPAR